MEFVSFEQMWFNGSFAVAAVCDRRKIILAQK